MEFQNKTVIVTGAATGIGRATALEFAKGGANVCVVDVNEQALENTARDAEALGAKVLSFSCDVGDEARVCEVVQAVNEHFGGVDILVNNAGLWRGAKPFVETVSSDWKKRIHVNILGTMYFTHEVLPSMLARGWGRVINVGSVAGYYGNKNMADYSMTKGAVSAFTKALAKEVADKGITVNNVVPGSVRNEGKDEASDLCYMNRRGELEEFAYLICFLASDKAAYISGQDYRIDGCRRKN